MPDSEHSERHCAAGLAYQVCGGCVSRAAAHIWLDRLGQSPCWLQDVCGRPCLQVSPPCKQKDVGFVMANFQSSCSTPSSSGMLRFADHCGGSSCLLLTLGPKARFCSLLLQQADRCKQACHKSLYSDIQHRCHTPEHLQHVLQGCVYLQAHCSGSKAPRDWQMGCLRSQ